MGITFRPATPEERDRLGTALRRNGEDGTALHLDSRDTSFVRGGDGAEALALDELITTIRSIPCHYAGDAITLPRTGKPPLRVRGEMLAHTCGARQEGRDRNRWHDLHVYESAASDALILAVQYRTRWEGELDHDAVWVIPPQEGGRPAQFAILAGHLSAYDPTAVVKGFPEEAAYADKQARLLADIRSRYLAQVSDLLEELGAVEEVE